MPQLASGAQNSCADSVPSNGYVRAIVALVLFPVAVLPAAFRAGYAVVRFFLVYLRVMLAVSRFRHDFLVKFAGQDSRS
jgi:hypothetical protein